MSENRHPLFMPVIFVGGLLFGLGLGVSHMTHPEVVLDFLQLEDFGLLFVMGGGGFVMAGAIAVMHRSNRLAPLTGEVYGRRVKSMDRNVIIGGSIFGVGWGLSGVCPGAAYASVGIGNYPILIAIAGMFAGAYVQGYWRKMRADHATRAAAAD